jgi:hypothetical protein
MVTEPNTSEVNSLFARAGVGEGAIQNDKRIIKKASKTTFIYP